ncbi:MAG: HU family DNA-binding protein [Bryobacteraceae bacterium]
MNKRHVIETMAAETQLSKVEAARALNSFLKTVRCSLIRGEKVTLMGFGTFATSRRKARIVREPRGGTKMQIHARRVARFVPGLELRMAVENGLPHAEDHSLDTRPS